MRFSNFYVVLCRLYALKKFLFYRKELKKIPFHKTSPVQNNNNNVKETSLNLVKLLGPPLYITKA